MIRISAHEQIKELNSGENVNISSVVKKYFIMGHNYRQHGFPVCIMCLTDRVCYSVAGGLCGFKTAF